MRLSFPKCKHGKPQWILVHCYQTNSRLCSVRTQLLRPIQLVQGLIDSSLPRLLVLEEWRVAVSRRRTAVAVLKAETAAQNRPVQSQPGQRVGAISRIR